MYGGTGLHPLEYADVVVPPGALTTSTSACPFTTMAAGPNNPRDNKINLIIIISSFLFLSLTCFELSSLLNLINWIGKQTTEATELNTGNNKEMIRRSID